MTVSDDLLSPGMVADPYPAFRALREEDPVHYNERHRSWLVTRYDDVVAGFRDPRLSADRILPYVSSALTGDERAMIEPAARLLATWMVFRDPPDHSRLRRLVSRAFTSARVEALRPRVEAIVGDLIDGLAARGSCDLVADFAYPLPATVIAELLGVPASDRDAFRAWSQDLASFVFGAIDEPDRRRRAREGMDALATYFRSMLARPAHDGLVADLAAADGLSPDEAVGTCVLLLFAGHETTTSLIANGTLALLRHPGELDRLRRDPLLAQRAVEELLRYEGPSKLSIRWVREDLEIRGRRIGSGQRVALVQAAANRDPEMFEDPDRLDLGRDPNPHLAFGDGIHHCLGAALARLESRIALLAVATRLPGLALATAEVAWARTVLGRGMTSLPLTFDRDAGAGRS